MAISFVNALIEASRTSATIDTTGADFLVMVGNNGSTDSDLSPTYNSVAMTKVFSFQVNNGTFIAFWVLKAPATGSNTLSIGSGTAHHCSASWYSGVFQANSDDGHNSIQKSGSGNLTVSVTTGNANDWLVVTKWDQDTC